ncbi:MAG: YfcE family phosphodiesterase [Desulfitobacteriaceae bacterium]
MRIGVLADTHLHESQALPSFVWDTLAGVDLILHAGDVIKAQILEDLAILAPVRAVRGNSDGWELADLPSRDLINHAGLRIGLIHGHVGVGRTTPERAFNAFVGGAVEVIVFGHSHQPYLEWRDNILLFNSGSPTDKRREKQYSMGIIERINGQLEAKHHYF